MKVKFMDNSKQNNSIRLTLGKEYVVLSVEMFYNSSLGAKSLGDVVRYRIEDDDGIVIPFEADIFFVSSKKLPSNWVSFTPNRQQLEIVPATWAYQYFWDDYYNDKPEAIKVFLQERSIIYSQS
ncbi:hypothetical protein [Phosphitispora fastidiosa]|uniref:hypothetical protein n=1 Tax=Phosphitispora fastidiosa TaxID=2837202 RepID=UPI001E5E1965|nr:hypothetical protein [Phosphitispora fastidiosa]MBU7008835.1 hypothetical protein [Phosphitispora fastidiosa]